MTTEQMIAWLTLEGWVLSYTTAEGAVVAKHPSTLKMTRLAPYPRTRYGIYGYAPGSYVDTSNLSWGDASDAHVAGIFDLVQGGKS